jgi:hypothetical protein
MAMGYCISLNESSVSTFFSTLGDSVFLFQNVYIGARVVVDLLPSLYLPSFDDKVL